MTKQMREITQAIYELTLNPTATPSNWENLAEDVQVAILSKDEQALLKLLQCTATFSVSLAEPDPDIKPKLINTAWLCTANQ